MMFKNKFKKGLTWFLAMLGLGNIYLSPAFAQSGPYRGDG